MKPLRLILFLISISGFSWSLSAQEWTDPVMHPMKLSGSFGELRTNHFHAGIDIRSSKGQEGDGIFAVQDGYISRIRVHPASYGNVIYINHPNGITSVYAHLKDFSPEISSFIRAEQYRLESFQLDIEVENDLFPVSKGQQIGRMGNSGYSFGPHLHFELRNTETERIISPVALGIEVRDNIPPHFRNLHIYTLNEEDVVSGRLVKECVKAKNYKLRTDTLVVSSDRVGFGVEVFDKMEDNYHKNGVRSLDIKVDGNLIYQFIIDSISFKDSENYNAHLDYSYKHKQKRKVHRCFVLPGNHGNLYNHNEDKGVVILNDKLPHLVEIEATDANLNSSKLTYVVKWDGLVRSDKMGEQFKVKFNTPLKICLSGIEIQTDEETFYDDTYLDIEIYEDKSAGVFSPVFQLGDESIPMKKSARILVETDPLPEDLKEKAFLAKCSQPQDRQIDGEWVGDTQYEAEIYSTGAYCIRIDTIAPTLKVIRFPTAVRKGNSFKFKVTDNFKHASGSDGVQFEGRIDGEWVLVAYDYKNDLLTCPIDMDLEPGKHEFQLKVNDLYGNSNIFLREFTYQ